MLEPSLAVSHSSFERVLPGVKRNVNRGINGVLYDKEADLCPSLQLDVVELRRAT